LKPLRKRVRFAKAFHLLSRGNKFTSNYKNLTSGLQTKGEFTSFKELVRTCKELRAFVKRVGAIQVFCPKASRAESLSIDGY
jgi:hypothetical protein